MRGCMTKPLGIETVMKSGRCAPTGVPQPGDRAIAERERHRVDALRGHRQHIGGEFGNDRRTAAIRGAGEGELKAAVMLASPASGQKLTPFCTAR